MTDETVWVLTTDTGHCCGVFRSRHDAEREAESILGGVERRQYEDWITEWERGEGVDEGDVFFERRTDCEKSFILREVGII